MGLPQENADDVRYTFEETKGMLMPDSVTVHSRCKKGAAS